MFISVAWVTLVRDKQPITRVVVMVHFVGGSSCRHPSYKVYEAWLIQSSLWGTAGPGKKGVTDMI